MARVVRPGGYVYIDHEFSDGWWSGDACLGEYRAATRLSPGMHVYKLLRTGEAFSFAFAKTVFMKLFVNRRYEREGDIHVWPDDHIEWDRIAAVLEESATPIVKSCEYLLYRPRGGESLYQRYRDRCSDLRYVFARKAARNKE
jgi:hypothetical protein